MGEFYAWAATGQVARLQSWSHPESESGAASPANASSTVLISSKLVEGQRFALRQRDGKEVEIILSNAGVDLRNGEVVTTVWAAREGAAHGYCVVLENHSSGTTARLPDNVKLIRPKANLWQTARFGVFAAIPAALALLLWLLAAGSVEAETVLVAGTAAMAALFLVGFIVSKLVFDYLRSEDEQKLWQVVDRALGEARHAIHQNRR